MNDSQFAPQGISPEIDALAETETLIPPAEQNKYIYHQYLTEPFENTLALPFSELPTRITPVQIDQTNENTSTGHNDSNYSILHANESSKQQLTSLLENWNLGNLLEHFISQNIYVDILKIIKRHHIDKILKEFDFGTQILFEHHLEEWRQSIGMPLMELPNCHYNNDSNGLLVDNRRLISIGLQSPAESIASSTSEKSISSTRFEPYRRPATPDDTTKITLSNILNETRRGMMLVEYYNKFSKFQEDQRLSLINTIARYFEDKSEKMSLRTSYQLEQEILERFPSEKLEYYRTSKRGRIYIKMTNLKTSLKSLDRVKHQSEPQEREDAKKSRQYNILEPEADVDSCLKALRFDNLTSEQFDNCWKACVQFRLHEIRTFKSTSEIMEKWPFYKSPSGYRLVDMNFSVAFDNSNELLNKWDSISEKLLSFLTSDFHLKDKLIKGHLEKLTSENVTNKNRRDATLFWSLHGYFVPTSKIVKKDSSGKKSIVKFTIKDSQESFLFIGKSHQEIDDHLMHLKQCKNAIQPFLMCTGDDSMNIQDIYVYFDDIKYVFKNFLRAVDVCFKIIYLFNLDFPVQSKMFWNFIEVFFFKFKPNESFSKVCILNEYLSAMEQE